MKLFDPRDSTYRLAFDIKYFDCLRFCHRVSVNCLDNGKSVLSKSIPSDFHFNGLQYQMNKNNVR